MPSPAKSGDCSGSSTSDYSVPCTISLSPSNAGPPGSSCSTETFLLFSRMFRGSAPSSISSSNSFCCFSSVGVGRWRSSAGTCTPSFLVGASIVLYPSAFGQAFIRALFGIFTSFEWLHQFFCWFAWWTGFVFLPAAWAFSDIWWRSVRLFAPWKCACFCNREQSPSGTLLSSPDHSPNCCIELNKSYSSATSYFYDTLYWAQYSVTYSHCWDGAAVEHTGGAGSGRHPSLWICDPACIMAAC